MKSPTGGDGKGREEAPRRRPARETISRVCRSIPRALGLVETGTRDLCLVLKDDPREPAPIAFTDEGRARRYLRFLHRQQEEAGDEPTDLDVTRVRLDPEAEERPGAWVVCIDRDGRPVGPAKFSLARRPDDPPHELDFRSDVEPIREIRDFVGYGRTRAAARESAERLRERAVGSGAE